MFFYLLQSRAKTPTADGRAPSCPNNLLPTRRHPRLRIHNREEIRQKFPQKSQERTKISSGRGKLENNAR